MTSSKKKLIQHLLEVSFQGIRGIFKNTKNPNKIILL